MKFFLDSSVGIATCYGIHGPDIELGKGEYFFTRPDRSSSRPSLL